MKPYKKIRKYYKKYRKMLNFKKMLAILRNMVYNNTV